MQNNNQDLLSKIIGLTALFSGFFAIISVLIISNLFSIPLLKEHNELIIDYYYLKPEYFIINSIQVLFGYFVCCFSVLWVLIFKTVKTNRSKNINKYVWKSLKLLFPFLISFIAVCIWIILKNSENSIIYIPAFMMIFAGLMLTTLSNAEAKLLGLLFIAVAVISFFNEEWMLLYWAVCFGFFNLLFGAFLLTRKARTF